MKVTLEEACREGIRLIDMANKRMKNGTEKYGEEMVQDPLTELGEELADAINYIILGFIKARRAFYEFEQQEGIDLRRDKGDR